MARPRISFEFFPPKTLDAAFRLWDTVHTLKPLEPGFVSVTFGAGGTTRHQTHEAVDTIHRHFGLNVAAHLTCVGASRAETLAIAQSFADAGVTELVTLRGDPPAGTTRFTPHPEGFTDSCDLIAALAETGTFTLRVGAYPDTHPEAADPAAGIRWLKRKFEAGAHSAITQFFFEADTFLRFRDACHARGITAPIIPGILPIENWDGVRNFANRCGTTVPAWLDEAFDTAKRDGTQDQLATRLCTEMCAKLLENGVDDLHFYTLNKPQLTWDICQALGLGPRNVLQQVA
ncbi:MAG: methylenetetrahydrofolate reductase [NAD(P)H] [Qingshengfaniella sp.]